MSGDIGAGTTHAALRYGQALLASGPPGFVQLAGGTNHHTATKFQALNRDRPGHPQSIPASYPERAVTPYLWRGCLRQLRPSSISVPSYQSWGTGKSLLARWSQGIGLAPLGRLRQRPSPLMPLQQSKL
jgi:hypothetical protein